MEKYRHVGEVIVSKTVISNNVVGMLLFFFFFFLWQCNVNVKANEWLERCFEPKGKSDTVEPAVRCDCSFLAALFTSYLHLPPRQGC